GVSAIGALMMTGLALTVQYFQPDAAVFAAICFGAMLGFLVWNFHPAKIFLGEGGSTFVGFTIGTLAVIGGAKLGTALLVLSIPFLDVVWVILRRTLVEHHSPTKGDRKHLHHRLLDLGLSQRQVVLIYYAIAAVVGILTLFLQSREKVILFAILVGTMILGATALVLTERKKAKV
ncbi:MAG: MraY family glycosyltransferase, partial [Patescibacteria group bacterium]